MENEKKTFIEELETKLEEDFPKPELPEFDEEEAKENEDIDENVSIIKKKERFFPDHFIILPDSEVIPLPGQEILINYLATRHIRFILKVRQSNISLTMNDRYKEQFETLHSLRIYIERNGRPNNYLKDEKSIHAEYLNQIKRDMMSAKNTKQLLTKNIQKKSYIGEVQQFINLVEEVKKAIHNEEILYKKEISKYQDQSLQ